MENARPAVIADFGALLRRYRRAAGLSQGDLADRALMSPDGIGALERGRRRLPQRATISRLADALTLDAEQRRVFEATAELVAGGRLAEDAIETGGWPKRSPSHLPFALTSFVGRKTELEEITALLRDHRLVTLTGAGGIGKTQTALHAATGLTKVCVTRFVALAPIADAMLVVPAIAAVLGIQQVSDRPLLQTLIAALKNRGPLLLVLDNCEQVLAEARRIVYELLVNASQLRILATSREALKTAGEYAYRLPPLAERDAVALFADRARAVDHRFTVVGDTEQVVAEICRRLDGMPLAIELAAARVSVLPVTTIAAQLKDRFRLLAGGVRTAQARQQTLRAAIDWSCDLLTEKERRVFDRLSVFAGGFTLEAAHAVGADPDFPTDAMLDLLASLVDKSLVVADLAASEPRYQLLESFREYARERLAAAGELDALKHRHAACYFDVYARLSKVRWTAEEAWWVPRVLQEGSNVRAALRWALFERGDVELGQRLVGLLARDKALSINYSWARPAAALINEQTPTEIRAMLAHAEAYYARSHSRYRAQLESSQLADALYREVGDVYGSLKVREMIGLALLSLGELDEADRVLKEALAPAREQNDPILVGDILRALSGVYANRGDIDASRAYADEAIAVFEAGGASWHAIYALDDRAECEFLAGRDAASAKEITLRCLERLAAIGDETTAGFALAHNALAVYEIALAQYDLAAANARTVLKWARTVGHNVLVAWSLQHLAAIAALRPRATTGELRAGYLQAARTTGFVDAALTALRAEQLNTQREEHGRTLAALRDALGAELLEELRAEGAAMTEDEAVEKALTL